MSALTLEAITVKRGSQTVVSDVTSTFAVGRLTAVIGPNGAGKSTLLQAAAGLLPIQGGRIRLGENDIFALGRHVLATRRAYLPQRASVEWPISVERVVALGLIPQLPSFGALPDALLPAIEKALSDCDLVMLRKRQVTKLSGGELARVMLARAIVGDPELLIVDEPTAGLDPRHAIDALQRLRMRAQAGRTVVVAIHDLDLAHRFADDIVAMRDGKLLAAGPIESVMTEDLLAALYDVRVRLTRDSDGTAIRFLD